MLRQRMNDNEALAFLFVRNGGDGEDLPIGLQQFVQLFFDSNVGNHFAADFAEATKAIGDTQEAVFIDGGDIAGVVPAAAKNFCRFFRTIQIANHDIGPANKKQARLIDGKGFAGFRIDDANANAGKGMADGATLGADLTEVGGAEVVRVDGDHRRAFGAAVTFERAETKVIFEGLGDALGEFLGAGKNDAQAAKGLGRATAGVGVEEGWSGKQHGDGKLADQRADSLGVERTDVEHHADTGERRKAERAGEAEGMEEGKNAKDAVAIVKMEDLFELLDVRSEIEVGKDHAFGLARRAAGENNCLGVVEGSWFRSA